MFFFDPSKCPTIEILDSQTSEAQLIDASLDGDGEAFVELAGRYHARVWKTASRFARNRAELEDLVQDLFIRIWKGLPTFRNISPFEHWLMRVTVRGCYDFLRKNRKRRESEILAAELFDHATTESAAEHPSHRASEASEIVAILLGALDAKDRTVITLLDLEEKSVRETAELTGWSESNIKVIAHRARKKMKIHFEKLGLER
jgi:RNA polymerase sigma-70 factor, ECF subfamily